MTAFDEAVERARKAVGKAIANGALPSGIARVALKAACEGMPRVELVHHGKWGIVPASAPDKKPAPGFHVLLPLPEEAPNGEREEP